MATPSDLAVAALLDLHTPQPHQRVGEPPREPCCVRREALHRRGGRVVVGQLLVDLHHSPLLHDLAVVAVVDGERRVLVQERRRVRLQRLRPGPAGLLQFREERRVHRRVRLASPLEIAEPVAEEGAVRDADRVAAEEDHHVVEGEPFVREECERLRHRELWPRQVDVVRVGDQAIEPPCGDVVLRTARQGHRVTHR